MKTALVLHGWPRYRLEKYFLINYLKNYGFNVITPNMFVRSYIFSPENVYRYVADRLAGKNLDLIVGISLGGLIAPYMAKRYPKSKMILIASGTRLRSESKIFNFIFNLAIKLLDSSILKMFLMIPNKIIVFFYQLANPFKSSPDKFDRYKSDMIKNIKFIKNIPLSEEKEILKFIKDVDNSELLKGIDNKTLIFSGENDLLMPLEEGKKLHKLLKNSELIIKSGSHFDTFAKEDLKTIDKFLH